MYKIGEFSRMAKTTIKTLRYYEKEGLLKPIFIDKCTNYRYYDSDQLLDVSKIISLRQVGLPIKDIKKVLAGDDIIEILKNRKAEIEKNLINYNIELSKINYLLECKNTQNEIFVKEIPKYNIYYRDGIICNFSKISEFICQTKIDFLKINPDLKKTDYCYISYLDGGYKERDIKIRYAQAIEKIGKETEQIKIMELEPITAICIFHKGEYDNLRDSYNIILKYIENNGYEIIDNPRECYIDGAWNKENKNDYLTEIQFPVRKI